MQTQSETESEQRLSELLDVAEMADDQLAKLGKPKGFDDARHSVTSYWLDSEDIAEVFTQEYIGLTYGLMMAEIYHSVLTAADPALALRKKQVETIFNLARYVVFLPEHTEDGALHPMANSALGITGELEAYAKQASELFRGMARWQILEETPDTLDETLNDIEAESLYWVAKANVLADLAPVFETDPDQRWWPTACLTASTSMWEHAYREALGISPAMAPKELDELYRLHSALLNICASGVRDPFLVWKRFRNVESWGIEH